MPTHPVPGARNPGGRQGIEARERGRSAATDRQYVGEGPGDRVAYSEETATHAGARQQNAARPGENAKGP